MRIENLFFFFLIFVFIRCNESDKKVIVTTFNAFDKEIYELSLNLLDSTKTKTFILLDSTSYDYQLWTLLDGKSYMTDMRKLVDTLDKILVNDFNNKNIISYSINDSIIKKCSNIFINNIKKVDELSLDKLYDQYKNFGGVIELSRIGYNKDETKAILFVGLVNDSLGGEGNLYYLERHNTKWIIKNIIQVWVA